MELFKAIESRLSYRGAFLPDAVPRADLQRIVAAGILAPSGYNAQSTSFVIVDEPQLIAEIARITGNDVIRGAPALVVVVMDLEPPPGKVTWFGVEDYAAAAENMLLAVTALGYASVWMDGLLRKEGRARRIGQLLGVPDRREVRVVMPIGRPAERWVQAERKPFGERAWFNGWRRE
jgi:nitroreductase